MVIADRRIRKLDPKDILLPSGYKIEIFWTELMTPINLMITDSGDMLVANSGVLTGNGEVGRLTPSGYQMIADGFHPPLTGINEYEGNIFVSHRGAITVIKPDGQKEDILSGLPSWGDHHNNRVVFGPDGKMYFGQGTATNSGVVGEDNHWVKSYPFFHDYPGSDIELRGKNYKTKNLLSAASEDYAVTGAYSPYGISSYPGETIKGSIKASGSILRANRDGSQLELIAWGLRNPFRIKFDKHNRLFAANHGIDERGSRPVANSPDEFRIIRSGMWYGWPDYTGGYPITAPMFKPENKPQPEFLLRRHPMEPPKPLSRFAPHSAAMGFDFNSRTDFAPIGDAFIAEFGSEAPTTTGGKPAPRVGHRVSRIDLRTGNVSPFAVNKTGGAASATNSGGFERPIDVVFGPNGEMYIVDFGIFPPAREAPAKTGVIWRVTKA
ncbi:glucose/sorbosone dehydrogenase [Scopulibacillus darangshiensis]|uniref:Glucose/sorbosone dehydrogenase n=1 Tax=Scopulibacillus darangshiensis TaxID=442528 RepID=A0A4V2SN09_9BACL|nr:PQQ-dependent sugar dehydrogenase [Scopulibacillus darangshiensis]TCP29416.1 glucose/sorbosone dehydrogenase [Scopulibacillus darangshiensis]